MSLMHKIITLHISIINLLSLNSKPPLPYFSILSCLHVTSYPSAFCERITFAKFVLPAHLHVHCMRTIHGDPNHFSFHLSSLQVVINSLSTPRSFSASHSPFICSSEIALYKSVTFHVDLCLSHPAHPLTSCKEQKNTSRYNWNTRSTGSLSPQELFSSPFQPAFSSSNRTAR
jgi:hypothetical protein